ncbi:MAG: hypothetical protein E4H36_14145 [Spirochaetales bacterium]|nr:MAG: hypothetical protein E4H36_14145 [Spirochaetales bacterium]
MDNDKLKDAVLKAVNLTFMDMALVDTMYHESCETDVVEFSHILHIGFKAPADGSMILFLPTACKRMIVENVYGSDWAELSADEIDDCLLELLSVLAGNFLTMYCGKETMYNMSFPEILFDESEVSGRAEQTEFCFDAEDVLFKVAIALKD